MRTKILAAVLAAAPFVATQEAAATTLTVDGAWDQADEFISTGSFFAETWDFTCVSACRLDVSDWAVISDMFEVFEGLVPVSLGFTSLVPSWNTLGCAGAFDGACYTTDPDAAWADGRYSMASFLFGAGSYLISVRNVFIPPTDSGPTFGDSTVQLRVVSAVPVPASLGLLAAGLGLLGAMRRRRT